MTVSVGHIARRIINSMPVMKLMYKVDAFLDNRFSVRGMLSQAFAIVKLNGIQGDYFEFGMFEGRTFLHARRLKRLHNRSDIHLWGFDSFCGLPEVSSDKENEIWSTGQFACSESDIRATLSAHGIEEREYTLVPGFYDQSLNDAQHAVMAGRTAAIVYIDCDLYESTVPVLNFIERYLVNGTIVCFDEFYCYAGRPDQGEQRALTEFLERNPHIEFQRYLPYCPAGQSFIVYRKTV